MEYYLNAVHYCLWLKQIELQRKSKYQVEYISEFLVNHLLSKRAKNKYNLRKEKNEAELKSLMDNSKNGFNIAWANHWFGYLYSSYPALFAFLFSALIILFSNIDNPNIVFILLVLSVILPIGLAYIPVYNSLYKKDKYIKYFKKFEKEDDTWQKKWEKRTNQFIIGAIIMDVIGLISLLAILALA